MRRQRFLGLTVILMIVTGILALSFGGVVAGAPTTLQGENESPAELFLDPNEAAGRAVVSPALLSTEKVIVLRARSAEVAPALRDHVAGARQAQAPQAVALNLFEDTVHTLLIQQAERTGDGEGIVWRGQIEGQPLSSAALVMRAGAIVGDVHLTEPTQFGSSQVIQIRPQSDGTHLIREVAPGRGMGNQEDFERVPEEVTAAAAADPNAQAVTLVEDGSVIDIMVVYTPRVRNALGSTANVRSEIDLAIALTNQAYANSDVAQRLRLVHAAEVNYTESGRVVTDGRRLTLKTDGYLDEVHALRDQYKADIVSIWVKSSSGDPAAGWAWLLETLNPTFFEAYAFNSVDICCATGSYVFGHELGHNMGAKHDWYVDDDYQGGAFTYSHGYVDPACAFKTIMAYGSECRWFNPAPHFSNPTVRYNGKTTGVAPGTSLGCTAYSTNNPPCDADNRLTFNNTAQTVANFRVRTDAPLSLPATGEYGLIQNGDQSHPNSVTFSFAGQSGPVQVDYEAWDVDLGDEVEILLNGQLIDFVPAVETGAVQAAGIDEVSVDNAWTSHSIVLPDDRVNDSGLNLLTFNNAYNPPNTFWWGVRSVALVTPIPLPATDNYGRIQDGDQSHVNSVTFSFAGQSGALLVEYDAWDIDAANEVEILLNGHLIGTVPAVETGAVQAAGTDEVSVDNAWTSHTIVLPDDRVSDDGPNLLTFNNAYNPPNTFWWGVRNVALVTPIPLPATGNYGRIQNGDQSHVNSVTFSFAGQSGALLVEYDAWDVDAANEVEILLNGQLLGTVPSVETGAVQAAGTDEVSVDNAWTSHTIVLPDNRVSDDGPNLLTFNNTYNPPNTFWWGVREVRVVDPIPLPATGNFGRIQNGDQSHPNSVTFSFAGLSGPVQIGYQAWDVDFGDEVEILLNGKVIGFVPAEETDAVQAAGTDVVTENEAWTSHNIVLPDAHVNNSSPNLLTFNNAYNPPNTFWWGTRNVRIVDVVSSGFPEQRSPALFLPWVSSAR